MSKKKKKKRKRKQSVFLLKPEVGERLVRERGVRSGRVALVWFWTQPRESCCSAPHRTDESDAAAAALALSLSVSLPSSLPCPPSRPWLHIDVITILTFVVFYATTVLGEPCTAEFTVRLKSASLFAVIYLFAAFFAVSEVFWKKIHSISQTVHQHQSPLCIPTGGYCFVLFFYFLRLENDGTTH